MIRSKAAMGFLWALLAFVLHVVPGPVRPAHAQGSRKDDIVFNSRGIPLAGATVRVCAMPASGQPCTPLALIYSDAALTQALANPTTTDGLGNYFFYAAPGKYEIEISGPGITTKQLPNIILPNDPSSPTFSGISAFSLSLSGNLTVSGNTTVVGNLASGTLNLADQGTPPGAATSGTVNLYTKTADKLLYYKDDTGTETGPLGPGAQTNVTNNWTAQQNWNANARFKGPNPYVDVAAYNVRGGTASTTATTTSGQPSVTLAAASTFQNGDGVTIYGAGATNTMSTPGAPTVTTNLARVMTGTGDVTGTGLTGATTYNYKIIARDFGGGFTAASATGSVTTGPSSLGSQSVSVTSCTRSNTTATCVTGSAHGLVAGAMVIISGFTGTDASFNGWYQLNAAPSDNTHFTFTSGQDTRNGAPTATTTSATVFWFNCNHLTWSAVTGAYQYYIYSDRGSPGTFNIIGASWPVNGSFTDGTLAFDDFGSPMMDGFTAKPASIPSTAPSVAANDYLTTTIVSGAGTTTLTLAANAGQSISGVTILYDDAPNVLAAATAAQGRPLYFLGVAPVINSPIDLATNTSLHPAIVGGMTLNDVMKLGSTAKWDGQGFPVRSSGATFQFQSAVGVSCNVSPCVHIPQNTTEIVSHLLFQGKGNAQTMMVADAGGGSAFGEFDYDYFQSGTANDYMNIGLVVRGWSGFLSGGTRMRGVNFTASQLANGSTATPMFYCDACSDVTIESIFYSGRAMLHRADAAGSNLVIYRGYIQGNPGPFLTLAGNSAGGGPAGLNLEMNRVQLDTTFQPALVYLPSVGTLSANVKFFSVPAPQLGTPQTTGNALTFVNGITAGGATGPSQNTAAIGGGGNAIGNNFTDLVTGVTGIGAFSSMFPPAAAPTVTVVPGTNNSLQVISVGITWVDAAGRISGFLGTGPTGTLLGGLGVTTTFTLTTGNQNFNVTPPTPPAGAIGYYMWSSAGTGPWTVASGSCGTALVTPANATANDVRIGNCGLLSNPGGAGFASLTSSGLAGSQLLLGGGSAKATISGTFTANRTQTLPDVTGTVPVSSYQNSAYDNATRANGAIGSNWTVQVNGLNIASNQIQGTTAASSNTAFWNANLFSPVQFAQATITALNGASDFPGVTVLSSGASSTSTYYDCVENSTTIFIQRVVNAGTTNLTNTASTGAVGDILRLEVAPGGALTCYKNGAVALTATDTQITAGSPGLLISGNVATEKNWSGGNLHPLAQLDAEQDWTRTQHFAQGIALGGAASESFNNNPRSEQNVFLPGALTSTWTGSTWTPDKAVAITRVQVQAKTAPAGCTTNAVVRLTDGTTPVNVTISAAANDSGAISQNYAGGAPLQILVQTAAAGCTTSPADANVTVQYRMQ